MAILIQPGRWRRNPSQLLQVDWDHPLSQNLLELGYIAAGRPHSAMGGPNPFVSGASSATPTNHGGALTLSGSPNHINLGRNVSAPTAVASVFVRAAPAASTKTHLFSSANSAGATIVGHYLRRESNNGLSIFYGHAAGGGLSPANYRIAYSPTNSVPGDGAASFAGVVRSSDDIALYHNGAPLSGLTYAGTGSYAPGTNGGSVNFGAYESVYGSQAAASWAYWSRALTLDEVQLLEEKPFAMLRQPRRRVWVEVAAGGGKGFPFPPPMRGFIHMLVR